MTQTNKATSTKVRRVSPKRQVTLDVGPLFDEQWTGIPVFTRRLAESLLRHEDIDVGFSYNLTQIPNAQVEAAIKAGTGVFLRDQFARSSGSTFDGYGVIDPAKPILFPSVKESCGVGPLEASTVHDLGTLFMPENCEAATVSYHLRNFSKELETNNAIFCVSEATKAALLTAYPSARSKAKILYQYVDWPEHFELIERNMPSITLGRYAVVVGTLEPRKNLGLLLHALARPEILKSDFKFVIIGRKGWKIDQFLADLKPEQKERLVFTGFVSEFIKYRLIKHADFLVFPSVYEGFGIPALEAMSLGKPVLASRTSSFPEVIGDAGVYFDPFSIDEFSESFVEISKPSKLKILKPKALKNSKNFNWNRTAEAVVDWLRLINY